MYEVPKLAEYSPEALDNAVAELLARHSEEVEFPLTLVVSKGQPRRGDRR
jgi:hypothetical protein